MLVSLPVSLLVPPPTLLGIDLNSPFPLTLRLGCLQRAQGTSPQEPPSLSRRSRYEGVSRDWMDVNKQQKEGEAGSRGHASANFG